MSNQKDYVVAVSVTLGSYHEKCEKHIIIAN